MKYILSVITAFLLFTGSFAQHDGLPAIPYIDEGQFSVHNQTSFLLAIGAAVVSYGIAEFAQDHQNLNFLQGRLGYKSGTDGYQIFIQNFGLGKTVAPWFAIAAEANVQEWTNGNNRGIGGGIMTYYRWYAFGNKKLSPYMEHGAGLFFGATPFPANGSKFTFNLHTQLGLEYTLPKESRIRLSYGHIHQSNNGLFAANPGYAGNGLNLSYAHFLGRSSW
ncbi:MAG: acyloxyacyl hydrolase [Bacteroidota bacterium]